MPEISAQVAVAEVLGALDDKIAANSRLITKVGEVLETTFALLCGQPDEMVPFSEIATITKGVSYRSADLCDSSTALRNTEVIRQKRWILPQRTQGVCWPV